MRLLARYASGMLLCGIAACQSDARLSKDLVGTWTWNPRATLPPAKVSQAGFPTPDLEAIRFDTDGGYLHVQRIPGYETVVFDKPFQVKEQWREWKGAWSVAKGQLTMDSGPEKERWGARHEPSGWVPETNPTGDDRDFKIAELTKTTLHLETRAIGDVDRTLSATKAMPERPEITSPKP